MIYAIILAAGQSRRMGCQKLLLPFGDRTVIGRVVSEVRRSTVTEVLVVIGPDGRGIAGALAGWRVSIVTNPNPDGDMLSSVRCGLRAVPAQCETILVAVGDQPAITADLINEMIRAFRTTGKGVVVPVHDGKRGHPLLFTTGYRDEILTRYDGVGLRGLVQAHADDLFELKVAASAVLSDMDYPEDYRRELARLAPRSDRPGVKVPAGP